MAFVFFCMHKEVKVCHLTLPAQKRRVCNSQCMVATARPWPKARWQPFHSEFSQCRWVMKNSVRPNPSGVLSKKQRKGLLGKLGIELSKCLAVSCCILEVRIFQSRLQSLPTLALNMTIIVLLIYPGNNYLSCLIIFKWLRKIKHRDEISSTDTENAAC